MIRAQRFANPPWKLLPVLALLTGCNATMPKLPGDLASSLIPGGSTTTPTPALTAARPAAPLLRTREGAGMTTLFAKGTVSGADLLPELRAFRRLSGGGRSSAYDGLFSAGAAPASGMGNPFSGAATKLAMSTLESALKSYAMDIAFGALQGHLDGVIGDERALAAETIELPKAQALKPEQMQRAVTLAAIVVATRLSGRMLKQAQQDLASLETEYQTLIERREKAATLLQQALSGGIPAAARSAFTDADLQYLRELSAREGVAGFAKDMGAQTKALQLVALTDPKAFADYSAQSEGLTRRQTAALRTVAGVTAFGGLLVVFGHELSKLGKDQPVAEFLLLGPLVLAAAREVPPVLEAAYGALSAGFSQLAKPSTSFRVELTDGKTQEVAKASEVFELIQRHNASRELQRAMFRDAGRGLLQQVYQCNAPMTARMLDSAVPYEHRHQLASELRQNEPESFSFVNALADERNSLASDLLGQDHRPRLADRKLALARVQAVVGGLPDAQGDDGIAAPGYLKWNNEELLSLLFANRDGLAARYATLQIEGLRIKPVPSMQSLYAYESQADACRRQTLGPAAAPAATPSTTAPAAAPAPRPPRPQTNPRPRPTTPATPAAAPASAAGARR
ncbi:MAG: hypothetical protein KBC73_25045 [Burkholderiaceae bacterium]|nr:hypothetical protein [Burkholderiaceae bacterium]